MQNKCTNCGSQITDNDYFCPNCGTKIKQTSTKKDIDNNIENVSESNDKIKISKNKITISVVSVLLIISLISVIVAITSNKGKNYNISFDSCGGTYCSSIYTVGKEVLDLPSPTRNNYYFGGWYTGKKGTGSRITNISYQSINLSNDLMLYACWYEYVDYNVSISKYSDTTPSPGGRRIWTIDVNVNNIGTSYYYATVVLSVKNSIEVTNLPQIKIKSISMKIANYTTLTFTSTGSQMINNIPASQITNFYQYDVVTNIHGTWGILQQEK